jgi:hypothetical protein
MEDIIDPIEEPPVPTLLDDQPADISSKLSRQVSWYHTGMEYAKALTIQEACVWKRMSQKLSLPMKFLEAALKFTELQSAVRRWKIFNGWLLENNAVIERWLRSRPDHPASQYLQRMKEAQDICEQKHRHLASRASQALELLPASCVVEFVARVGWLHGRVHHRLSDEKVIYAALDDMDLASYLHATEVRLLDMSWTCPELARIRERL